MYGGSTTHHRGISRNWRFPHRYCRKIAIDPLHYPCREKFMAAQSGWMFVASASMAACATPPRSNTVLIESVCARRCSNELATCSAGYRAFVSTQQKQCNDNYDVCVDSCPTRSPSQADLGPAVIGRRGLGREVEGKSAAHAAALTRGMIRTAPVILATQVTSSTSLPRGVHPVREAAFQCSPRS